MVIHLQQFHQKRATILLSAVLPVNGHSRQILALMAHFMLSLSQNVLVPWWVHVLHLEILKFAIFLRRAAALTTPTSKSFHPSNYFKLT